MQVIDNFDLYFYDFLISTPTIRRLVGRSTKARGVAGRIFAESISLRAFFET
jgi:hypothetical protein